MKRFVSGLVLVGALWTSAGAATAAPVTPPPGPAPPKTGTTAESIPVPQIARRADEASQQLHEFDTLRAPDGFQETMEQRLAGITARAGAQVESTDLRLEADPSGATLEDLTAQWQALRAELMADVEVLARRATQLETALGRLTTLQETWSRTRDDARASRAPAPVLGRIDRVLADVAEVSGGVQAQRIVTLVLQDRFAREVARCEQVLGRITSVRQTSSGRLLERDSVALWDAEERARIVAQLPDHLRGALAADIELLRRFVREQGRKIPIHLALFLVLVAVMRAARRRAHLWSAPGETRVEAPHIFDRFVSAALMVALLAYPLIYTPPLPRALVGVSMMLALVPALRIMQRLLDPELTPGLYALGAFLLADLVRNFASVVPLLERAIFLLEMLGGTAVLTWLWFARRWPADRAAETITAGDRMLRLARGVALLAFVAAFAAGVAGYMKLALLLGSGILGNAYLALVLYTGVRVGDGLVSFALRVRPLRRLGMVQRHRARLERRVHGLLRWVAVAAWLVFALKYFFIWNTAVEVARAALGAEVRLGTVGISLGDVLVFAVTVGAAFAVSALVRFTLREEVYSRLSLGRGLPEISLGLLHYALVLAGLLLALAALGVDLTKITIVAGALGVGIGFGLQSVVNNFVSGALLLVERKVNVGDAIETGGITGMVQQLGMRACIVRTWEGAEVIVPNASLISERVTNWTLSDRRRRVDVAVGVAHGTSPEQVLDVMLKVARAHPDVLTGPAPVVLFLELGESALRFEVRAWTDRFDRSAEIRSELAVALFGALGKAGIEIAVPQREVRLRPT